MVSSEAARKRFEFSLDKLSSEPRVLKIQGEKLVLILDGQWRKFGKEKWTLYLIALKPIDKDYVIVLDPCLRKGKENVTDWLDVLDAIPISIRKRVIVAVSDGVRGLGRQLLMRCGWPQQRCHFHLLSALEKFRGRRKSLRGKTIRENVCQTVKILLKVKSKKRMLFLGRKLLRLSDDKRCPKRMRMIAREFLRHFTEYRLYLDEPEWNLPNTTGVMESVGSLIRRYAPKINTPRALQKWSIAIIRTHQKFNCKGTKFQPN
ncbi:hypothetical protein HZB94_04645 [Candidatus Falkowbacteria bacterium]|nr:hypothetical protein [Candidatus Falkowbacteria bacterium]